MNCVKDHLARIGPVGHLGRLTTIDGEVFRRGMSVVCRTARGLEFGEVLNLVQTRDGGMSTAGQILRGATAEDHLLWNRLQKHRCDAMDGCQKLLEQRRIAAVLMDCEVLFDGQSIFFYFLGDVSPEVEALTQELAEAYEAKAQLRQFAETMTLGCGPDCGTDKAGCASGGGCGTCSLVNACKTEANS